MSEMLNNIITGDNVEEMKQMDDNSIDLTVTSPPYDNLRKYKGFTFDFKATAKELHRITKVGGVIVWVVGDSTINGSETGTSFKQALHFMDIGLKLHDTMIFEKNNPIPLTQNRYEQKFEYMFIFSKGKPKTFNALMKDNKHAGVNPTGTFRHDGDNLTERNSSKGVGKQGIKYNIWNYSVGRGGTTSDLYAFKHSAMFPEKLAEDHILSWSNEGDLVMDCFGGAGTTAKMAMLNKRDYIHIDVSEEYNEIARQRLDESVKQKEIDDAQSDIFDFL